MADWHPRIRPWLLAGVLAWSASAAIAANSPRAFRIDMILYRGCEEACQSFQAQLAKLGVRAEFHLHDAAQDRDKVKRFVAEVKAAHPDLVIAWGTTVALETLGPYDAVDPAHHITDVPVLFMAVSQPRESKIVKSHEAPGRNASGVRYLLPIEAQLRAARAYLAFKRVGIIVNSAERNSLITRDEMRALAGRMEFTLIERSVPLDSVGKPDAAALPGLVAELAAERVDLIYQSPDTFLLLNSDALTTAAVERGIPVFAASEAPVVKSNALLGVVIKYQDVGRYTAYLAERILIERKRPQELPVELPRHFSYLVNMPVAKRLGRYPPLKLLDVAELIQAPTVAR